MAGVAEEAEEEEEAGAEVARRCLVATGTLDHLQEGDRLGSGEEVVEVDFAEVQAAADFEEDQVAVVDQEADSAAAL